MKLQHTHSQNTKLVEWGGGAKHLKHTTIKLCSLLNHKLGFIQTCYIQLVKENSLFWFELCNQGRVCIWNNTFRRWVFQKKKKLTFYFLILPLAQHAGLILLNQDALHSARGGSYENTKAICVQGSQKCLRGSRSQNNSGSAQFGASHLLKLNFPDL